MDLLPEDFEWMTSEILRIADICCDGKVVSVLGGGYGSSETYKSFVSKTKHKQDKESKSNPTSATAQAGGQESFNSAHSQEYSGISRSLLANSAVSHLKRLIDPYEDHDI